MDFIKLVITLVLDSSSGSSFSFLGRQLCSLLTIGIFLISFKIYFFHMSYCIGYNLRRSGTNKHPLLILNSSSWSISALNRMLLLL